MPTLPTFASAALLVVALFGCESSETTSEPARAGSSTAGANVSGATTSGGAKSGSGGSKSGSNGGSKSNGGASAAGGDENASGTRSEGGGAQAGGGTDCAHDGDGKTTLVFVNDCAAPVSFRGSDIDGGTLEPGAAACVDIGSDVESLSAKRYWGFRGEDPGAEHHTLAELTFNTDFNDFDWYNISHVDAFNLPMQIAPLARPKCEALTCAVDLVPDCPEVGRYEDSNGDLVACVSPDRNNAMSPVAEYFQQCDDAYAWSGDDQSKPSPVRACAGEDFQIGFCPSAP